MTKITMRETLERAMAALVYHQEQTRPIARTQIAIAELIAALAAQQAEPVSWICKGCKTPELCGRIQGCDTTESLEAGITPMAAQPAEAQPTGQSPCARHCEAPAFEGEIRRLKRELQTQAERIRVLREALEVATNWLSDDRHPIGWTVDRLRAALEATR